ncbi:HlyD family efflux transporter periplasmic adaptor subunit [Nitrogeniibacter mangrovi]|uniref:HlyD family efflux transporter periplasmic adaptor subunit n=1 Tax=Nitrogeniibacter mangrovi TaxID=2016596 RepID=A0A6C1AZ16_9RHOO|nr:efflux RND transporter periplasmic adaptor subunit [Nitrogeniibacter mangrovi]QID16586.1 HlyD family efflux transporter periplasmic adaptor subunit [Nitrogeniibacter mangrovi]
MNKKLLAIPVVLVAAAAAAWMATRDHAETANALVLQGNMDIREVDLAFNASGRVAEVLVREGDPVRKGQVLARLDTTRLALSLQQAQAQAQAQRSQVAKLKAGSRPEEIRQAAAERDAAQVAVREARQVYERQRGLLAKHFIAQQQVDSARNVLAAAQQRLKAADESYRLAQLGPRAEDVAAAEAGLAAQTAAVAGLEHDLTEGTLVAPEPGVIENRVLEPGDMASPQKTVLTLALTEPVWARVYLPEAALGRVPPGARAEITTDSHPDRKVAGWVGYVSPSAEFTPKSVETPELRTSLVYQARVFACEGQAALRQGMPVTVTIDYDQPAGQHSPCAGAR